MENFDHLVNKIKNGELNIQKLAKDTGIDAGRIYKWKGRPNARISLDDARKLEIYLANQKFPGDGEKLTKSPIHAVEQEVDNSTKLSSSQLDRILSLMERHANSIDTLSESVDKLAEANTILASKLPVVIDDNKKVQRLISRKQKVKP